MNNRIQQLHNDRIASLMGEIMDSNYESAFLKKHGLSFSTHEDDGEVRITEVELGKGKASRRFTLASYCDNRCCWHHDVFGSIAQLPVPRLKQIATELSEIVTARLEEEMKTEKKSTRQRRTPAQPRKNENGTKTARKTKPSQPEKPKQNPKGEEKEKAGSTK